MTLDEIAETLHAKGYRHRSGRPFVEVSAMGTRKRNISTISNIFNNWTYAGWVVSVKNNIPPKTIRGNWESLVTTEEFERGLGILAHRNESRNVRRKQEYLLKGMLYYSKHEGSTLIRLTGSTSNAGRANGGTAYYRAAATGGVSFLCRAGDAQIPQQLMRIQVDPELIPLIQTSYTDELAQKLGHLKPDEKRQIETALKAVEEEEARMARLFASGKITEAVWDNLWAEWQDRRQKLRQRLEIVQQEQEFRNIDNLDTALEIIAKIAVLYNGLERSDQKELLRQVVERVIVNDEGTVRLELRPPFAYLAELTNEIRSGNR